MSPLAALRRPKVSAYVTALEISALALLAYVPFLLSSPRRVIGDTKQYLYLDPGRLLSRAPYLWDPHVAAGTVPHQNIGYLFPMGPYYWVLDRLGVPDWVAQRLWLATITFAALLGARWLFTMLGTGRLGALAGALVYGLTPYQLAFTARISVLLLAWAGLPWLVGLTIRATRRGGWRDPALFALVILLIGGVNASSLILVGIGPVLWLVMELCGGRRAARAALAAAGRIGVLSVGVSIWWAVGLRLQGAYGLPVLQFTENVRTVSLSSSPDDLLRGLGNWFFYGQDRLGYSIEQADAYVTNHFVLFATFAVPVAALLAAVVIRWRYRAYFALLVIVGTVIGVGAYPYDNSTWYGARLEGLRRALVARPGPPQHRPGGAGDRARSGRVPGRRCRRADDGAIWRWRARSSSPPWPSWRSGRCGRPATCRKASTDRLSCRRTGPKPRPPCNATATPPASWRSPAATSPPTGGATPSSRSHRG